MMQSERCGCSTRAAALSAALVTLGACGGAGAARTAQSELPAGDGAQAVAAASATLPSELVASRGNGPALFTGSESSAAAVGYISPGVLLRITGADENGRVPVRIAGPLKVRGWFPADRLAARVQKRGKIASTPIYVGPNDLVVVRAARPDGLMEVAAAPNFSRDDAPAFGPYQGTYPVARLAAHAVDAGETDGPTPGTPAALPAGRPVPLYERPGGSPFVTLPALNPPIRVTVVRESGAWRAVRVGEGPYLLGYVNETLTPAPAIAPAVAVDGGARVPARLREEGQRPLWRVKAGARLKFDGRTIAIFDERGWARELTRYDSGEVDVFAAVNDDIAVRGMLRADELDAIPADAPTE